MKTYLKIQFENGAVWGIPLDQIADNRAKYYAEKDSSTTYQEEFDYVMKDSYEAIDWFRNNMNWGDILAQQLQPPREFKPSEHLFEEGTEFSIAAIKDIQK